MPQQMYKLESCPLLGFASVLLPMLWQGWGYELKWSTAARPISGYCSDTLSADNGKVAYKKIAWESYISSLHSIDGRTRVPYDIMCWCVMKWKLFRGLRCFRALPNTSLTRVGPEVLQSLFLMSTSHSFPCSPMNSICWILEQMCSVSNFLPSVIVSKAGAQVCSSAVACPPSLPPHKSCPLGGGRTCPHAQLEMLRTEVNTGPVNHSF